MCLGWCGQTGWSERAGRKGWEMRSLPVAALMIRWLQTSQLFYPQVQRLDAPSQTQQADAKGQARLAASAGPCEQSVLPSQYLGVFGVPSAMRSSFHLQMAPS